MCLCARLDLLDLLLDWECQYDFFFVTSMMTLICLLSLLVSVKIMELEWGFSFSFLLHFISCLSFICLDYMNPSIHHPAMYAFSFLFL